MLTACAHAIVLFRHQHAAVLVQAACFASTGTEVLVFYQFYTMSRPSYSSTGALLDGGLDLNQPGGLTEYVPVTIPSYLDGRP